MYPRKVDSHRSENAQAPFLVFFENIFMIKCHFSRLLGERKLKVAVVARETGLNQSSLHRLYNESFERIELDLIEILCAYFSIGVGDLLEYVPGEGDPPRTKFRTG
jgi:putative transcriptional regulator